MQERFSCHVNTVILFEYSQQIPCAVQLDEGIGLSKERSGLSTEQKVKFEAIVEN